MDEEGCTKAEVRGADQTLGTRETKMRGRSSAGCWASFTTSKRGRDAEAAASAAVAVDASSRHRDERQRVLRDIERLGG